MRRIGKYRRYNASGRPMKTLGDPVLDMIVDEDGWIVVGSQRFNLMTLWQARGLASRGGVRSINFSSHIEDLRRWHLQQAMTPNGAYRLVEVGDDSLVVASRNPSNMWHYSGNAAMRFNSWRSNYKLYWSIGSEIETWVTDFTHARIESTYGTSFGVPGLCAVIGRDSDTDANDNYMDEWEWGAGVSSPPTGVHSWCEATWRNQNWRDPVQSGECNLLL